MKRVLFKHWQGVSNKRIKNIKNKNKRIAIIAASRKLGVTHMCLSLANFISGMLKEQVLYIELCENSQLLGTVGNKLLSYEGSTAFLYKGVTYVLACSVEEAKRLISNYKGYVIVDIYQYDDATKFIFDQCDKQIVIGSMKPWCVRDLQILIKKLEGGWDMKKRRSAYIIGNNEGERKNYKQMFNSRAKRLPVIENPFSLKEKDFEGIIEMIE
jgi:hypothetical protein